MKIKRNYIKIENLKQYLINIRQIHPDSPEYLPYWRQLKKQCIEGLWGYESGIHNNNTAGYRYMPGRLFFYGNFCTILDVDEQQNTRKRIRPDIRDIEWERAYMVLEARGFSGWTLDEEYTSDLAIKDPESIRSNITRYTQLFKLNGELKTFINPRDNIRRLHDKPMGVPTYWNNAKNINELGARGGGKSYFYSLAVAKYEVIFDGVKYYTQKNILTPPKAEICIGSGQQAKSADFIKKLYDSIQQLALDSNLGVWGKPGQEDYAPCPFYKEMAGSIKPNNKDNLYRHEYKVIENGREVIKGTGSYAAHVVYSINKPSGAEAAAGGRYNIVIYEEEGLTELLREAWGSNNATVTVGAKQFGSQIGLGTSGNMETILPSKEIFTHPLQYNCISFNDDWEESGLIGFFLPAYMTVRDYKDKDGNTDIDKAVEYFYERRKLKAKADNPHVLHIEKMNYPLVPSDMWQSNKGSILPVQEAETREKVLAKNMLYKKIGTNIKLQWDTSQPNSIKYQVEHNSLPFYEHKYKYERTDLSGAIRIFEFPQTVIKNNKSYIPKDMYWICHDPYVSDNIDEGDSLGASYVFLNPKYITDGFNGNTIVASYIGKPYGGRKEYYQNLEKLIAFYGNPTRGLFFEANRGDECKNYFVNKGKSELLALRPQRVQNTSIHQKQITQYGFVVSRQSKVELLDKCRDWLVDITTLSDGAKLNIERIPCIFLIRQIQAFTLEQGNYDAVSSFLGIMVAIKENEYFREQEIINKNKNNPLAFLSTNNKVFNEQIHY